MNGKLKSVIILRKNGKLSLIEAGELTGKVRRKLIDEDAEYLMIQTGGDCPRYAIINVGDVPKKFSPLIIRYKLQLISNLISSRDASISAHTMVFSDDTKELSVKCDNFVDFIEVLYSMANLYLQSAVLNRYQLDKEFDSLSNQFIAIGDLEASTDLQKVMYPSSIVQSIGDLYRFFAVILDMDIEKVLGLVNGAYKITSKLRLDVKNAKWGIDRRITSPDEMLATPSLFSNDVVFVAAGEYQFLKDQKITLAYAKMTGYYTDDETEVTDSDNIPESCIITFDFHINLPSTVDEIGFVVSAIDYVRYMILRSTLMNDEDLSVVIDIYSVLNDADVSKFTITHLDADTNMATVISKWLKSLTEISNLPPNKFCMLSTFSSL